MRSVQDDAYPIHTQLRGDNNAVVNCTFEGSEGPALVYYGSNVLVHNNEFTYNDWVGQGNFGTVNPHARGARTYDIRKVFTRRAQCRSSKYPEKIGGCS